MPLCNGTNTLTKNIPRFLFITGDVIKTLGEKIGCTGFQCIKRGLGAIVGQ